MTICFGDINVYICIPNNRQLIDKILHMSY